MSTIHWPAGIATEWAVSEDGLAWSLKLREGVRFHDGTMAKDVAYSLERYREEQFTNNTAALWASYLDRVETVDDHTVVIRLKRPTPLLMLSVPVAVGYNDTLDPHQYDIERARNLMADDTCEAVIPRLDGRASHRVACHHPLDEIAPDDEKS